MDTSAYQKFKGIAAAAVAGRRIRDEIPGIAEDYRNGSTIAEIIVAYDILENYGIRSQGVANKAVHNALAGYPGFKEIQAYEGLLGLEERLELAAAHNVANGRRLRDRGIGIFAQTAADQLEAARRLNEHLGRTPWTPAEERYLLNSSRLPEYQRGLSADCLKLSEELNELFHDSNNIRSRSQVSHKLGALRRAKGMAARATKWSSEEETRLQSLLAQGMSHRGITSTLNAEFHDGSPVRSINATRHRLRKLKD